MNIEDYRDFCIYTEFLRNCKSEIYKEKNINEKTITNRLHAPDSIGRL